MQTFKTYEELMMHYWGKIVPMAKAEGIYPWKCVRLGNAMTCHPEFGGPVEDYTFAITILEGKPVFVGDKLYWNKYPETVYTVHQEGLSPSTVIGIIPFDYEFDLSAFSLISSVKKRTLLINGHEVPEPMREKPELGTKYWYVVIDDLCEWTTWQEDEYDNDRFKKGICHTTKKAAIAHAKALFSFSEIKD